MASLAKWISTGLACTLMIAGPCSAAQAPAARPYAAPPPASAPAASTAPLQMNPAGAPDNNYILGPGDVVTVTVLGTNYTGGGRIDPDGKIQLLYLGALKISDETATEAADQIGKALAAGGYFTKPTARVDVNSYTSRYVTVLGAVQTPGLVSVDRAYRVSEILARVGGPRETAADYLTVTPENGAPKNLVIKDLITGAPAQDPFVKPGDKLYVPMAQTFYISGEVHSPSTLVLTPGLTVAMAIAKAGGLTDLGSNKGIKVVRKNQTLNIGLDDKVQPDDIITIKQRLF